MATDLDALERGRLRMSVGYGGHRAGRPLSPIEVATSIEKCVVQGGTALQECAHDLRLSPDQAKRFLQILKLPEDKQDLIVWGSGKDFVGFSAAVELARLEDPDAQRAVIQAVLSDRLTSKEVREVVQIHRRATPPRPIQECIDEVLGMRPVVERRYVFIGSNPPALVNPLKDLSQRARDDILAAGITRLGLDNATGRLGPVTFTLVGGEDFNTSMSCVGKDRIEPFLRNHITDAVVHA